MTDADEIIQAVKDGDVPAVKRLLAANPDLARAADDHRKTPLHWAAELDRDDVAAVLLDAGAGIEAETSWGATAFDWAATMGSAKVADLLLARGARGIDLVSAANLGRLQVVRAFLASGAPVQPTRPVPVEPDDHWVADSARMKGDVVSNAFFGACRNGHAAVAAFLLERGADVNAKGVFGGTALHWAAINGHRGTVEFLLSHGADVTIRDARFDSTPEGWAAEGGHAEIRDLLHRAGPAKV